MSLMVNQNGLYVPVSDILLPNGNAHEGVLDSSGNEYFSKETFPVQLQMRDGNNTVTVETWSSTNVHKYNEQFVTTLNGEYIPTTKYAGKHLILEAYFSRNYKNFFNDVSVYICNIDSTNKYQHAYIYQSSSDSNKITKTCDVLIPDRTDKYISISMHVYACSYESAVGLLPGRSTITLTKMYIT